MSGRLSTAMAVWLLLCPFGVMAQERGEDAGSGNAIGPAAADTAEAARKAAPVQTIAVLDYRAGWLDDPKERKAAGEMLFTIIADRIGFLPGLSLVERREIDKLLREPALYMTGPAGAEKSIEIGKVLSARFLLSGEGFKKDGLVYVLTVVINAETGEWQGIFTTADPSAPTSEVVRKVCDELVERLPATLAKVAPSAGATVDPVEVLRQRLGCVGKSWVIAASEKHKEPSGVGLAMMQAGPAIDQAMENELKHLLSGAGQTVKTLGKEKARQVMDGAVSIVEAAREQSGDYCIIAQGISEFSKRLSNDLVAWIARVETKIADAKTGAILAAGSLEARATDLGDELAARQALRKATRKLLLELAEKLPQSQAEAPPKADAEAQ